MTERHHDVRTMLRAFDALDFPYRTFGAAASRLPRGVPGEGAIRRDAGGAVERRPADASPRVEASSSSAVREGDRPPIPKAVASAPATVVLWAPPTAGESSARHDVPRRPGTTMTANTKLADIFTILAKD